MVFGGAMHADQEEHHPWLREEKALLRDLLDRGVPLLGVCLGAQLLAEAAGGSARRASAPEIGWHDVELTGEGAGIRCWVRSLRASRPFSGTATSVTLPPGATTLARSDVCLQAYRVGRRAWGIQFHAEVSRRGRGGVDRRLPLRRGRRPDRPRP